MSFLDRFAGPAATAPSATPPPMQRNYSPVPRRGPYLQPSRPGLNPRTSSLASLASSQSSISLPQNVKALNGSSLKNQLVNPSPNAPDPLEVLQNIIGAPPRKRRASKHELAHKKPTVVVEDIDFGGLSLQDFAEADQSKPMQPSRVNPYSVQSVEECMFMFSMPADVCTSSCDFVLQMQGRKTSLKTFTSRFWYALGHMVLLLPLTRPGMRRGPQVG